MPGIPTFADFLVATKTTKITSAREILNDAVKNTYLIRDMLYNRDASHFIRTGSRIKDTIQLVDGGSFEFYQPNATFNPQDRDTLTDVTEDWRFAKTDFGFNDETITLNEGNPEDIYVDLKHKFRQQAVTDMMNGLEDALFATPNLATMENGATEAPPSYSIPAFITENGQTFNAAWNGTVMGVDPVVEPRWRNKFQTYDAVNPADDENGLLAGFDGMWLQVKFESPDSASEYFETDRFRYMKILTNLDGHKMYKRLLRGGNDQFGAGPQDPEYNSPRYSGIPVKYISTLDTARLDPATGLAYPSGKPRFFFLNCMYLFPIFHSLGYMEQIGPVPGGIQQPFSHAVYFRVWYNLFCRSRQRQGIISPIA